MLDQFLKYLAGEARVIAQAPVIFLSALAVIGIAIWKIVGWRHAPKDDLIALYKARLDGATPDQARARIDKLEDVARRTVGFEWEPLTLSQIRALCQEVERIEKRRIQVMYLNRYGKDLAKTIAVAFEAAGWDVQCTMGSGFEDGLFVGRSPTIGPLLKAAIENTTPFKVICDPPNKWGSRDSDLDGVYVAVGTNPT